jgi:nicotinamidase/pyrazinamidase
MITLIIDRYQNDFITGTMSVKNAKSSVEETKKFIKKHRKEIDKIIFIVDWHPYNHCSFKKYGGEWNQHCIQYTPGACIEPKFLKFVHSLEIDYEVDQIGVIEEVNELGALNEIELVQDNLGIRYYFDSIVTADANTEFVICGVSNSVTSIINNMLEEKIVPKVFFPGIISNDSGKTFSEFVKLNKLEKIE